MEIIWIEEGLKVIQLSKTVRLFEAVCLDRECNESFYTSFSFSSPPYCPVCGKDNTNYVSELDINTVMIPMR